ncbi:unnamed protein product [Hymenolepis diminuta]|uniref:TPR_REGION domain-containing protein n=1 Tax=Hymenolepis diminuta TaxID=6216 RepID=A0A158QEV3_HYMDI|nr:unnamed protein product [Hymenolepis diminuta]
MGINVKECIKNAKESFQKCDYEKCLEVLKPVFEEEEGNKNITCLLLASACYNNLDKEDKAVDMVHKVLMLDNKNVQAWLGLSQFCMKNTDRFYMLAAHEKNARKHIECLSNLLQVMVCYRLELPIGLQPLKDICNAVLAGDNANPYALEARLRLMVESAIFFPFSEDLDCPESFTNSFTGLNLESVDLELMNDYKDRLSKVLTRGSVTAQFTLALAESFLDTCRFLQTGDYEKLRKPLSRLQRLSRIKVDERWQSQGFLDVHMLGFCLSASAHVSHEIDKFKHFPNVPPSTLSDFLTPRLLYTPVRIFGDSNPKGINPLNRVSKWASCMLLSNAAKSNLRSIIAPSLKYYTEECMDSEKKLTWPRPQTALFTESCIISNNNELLQNYVDVSTLKSFDIPEEYSIEVTLRIKLVKCLLNFHQSGSDKSVIAQEVLKLNNLKEDPGFTSHNHNLAGWILLKVPMVTNEEVLDHFDRGAKADRNYFINHLNAGATFYSRMKAYRRAYQALKIAWDIAPGTPNIAYLLACTLCKLGRPDKAFDVYKRVDSKLFSIPMYLNYGLIALRLKELNKCIPALQRVVAAQPKNALGWEILGEAYMVRGNYGIALRTLKRSIDASFVSSCLFLDPTRPLAHILYAQVCTALSHYPAAITAYDRVTELLKNQKLHFLHLLASKGLVEMNANLAIQELRSGMSTAAILHIEAALQIGARIRVPKVFMNLFKIPPTSKEDEEICPIGVEACANLSGIMLSLFIKSSTTGKMQREIVLAWICMGLLQLSQVAHLRTVELNGELAKPLFGAHELAECNLTLIQAETCFSMALKESKKLPLNSDQIIAFAWFGMASAMILGRDASGYRSTYAFAMAFKLCSKLLNAGICLASRLSSIDYEKHAKKVMDRCLDFDPKIHAYWFVMAQLTARNEFKGKFDIQPGQLNEFKCLLQAVEECFNLDALWHLVPSVFNLLRVCFGRYCPSSDKNEGLQLARLICAEYLNRCLALQNTYSACNLNASSAHYLEGLTAAFIKNTAETFSDAAEFIRLTSGLKFNPKSNSLRCAVLEQGLLYDLNSLPVIPLVEGWDAFLDSPIFAYEWLNLMFALSPTLEQAKQALALVKTWVYLRPNEEALWTLLAAAQRLYAGLQVVKKYKEKAKVMESGISCLQSATAVCQPCPTSEIMTKELVNYTNDAIVNEQAVFEILKPLVLRSAVFFPHVQGLSAALNRLCS